MEYTDNSFFKYCSIQNMERFLDIIIRRRLYAASYTEMNDPMEGRFYLSPSSPAILKSVFEQLHSSRICSLCQKADENDKPTNYLMWSHYADGHRGVCFDVSVSKRNMLLGWRILPVKYQQQMPIVSSASTSDIDDILSKKGLLWQNERESRVVKQYTSHKAFIEQSPYVYVKINAIYLGMKICAEKKYLLKKIISKCGPQNIHIYKMEANTNSGNYSGLSPVKF